jgi:hypothetical protein
MTKVLGRRLPCDYMGRWTLKTPWPKTPVLVLGATSLIGEFCWRG